MEAANGATEVVGGNKGHEEETIRGDLLIVYRFYPWKPISNCTGRYTCRNHAASKLHPEELLARAGVNKILTVRRCRLPNRPDAILVLPMNNSKTEGIISYVKAERTSNGQAVDDRYVHTLNTQSGFRRKLEAMGVDFAEIEFSAPLTDHTR